ncbi:MAG: Tad domain-containing protein, partial [Bacillota bacterium]
TMVIVALFLTLLLLFTGLALDLGRAHLLRAQLQTAVDAGALAGALQVQPMVALEVDRWLAVEDWCMDPVSGEPYPCLGWSPVNPATATGPWRELIGQGRWRLATAAQCSWPHRCSYGYRIESEWLTLPPAVEQVARETLLMNATWPRGSHGAIIRSVDITVDRQQGAVTAAATLQVPTHFLRLIGIDELRLTRSGTARPVRR